MKNATKRILAAAALLLAVWAPSLARAQEAKKPPRNVLFIIADDMNDNLGCYGHPFAKTPNIDKLAARGVKFTNAYTNFALCNPCRTSFLSGRYPEETRVLGNAIRPRTFLGDITMLPEYFDQKGYFTARVGKIAHELFADEFKWDVNLANGGGPAEASDEDGPAANNNVRQQRRQQRQAAARPGEKNDQVVWVYQATDEKDENTGEGRMVRRIAQLMAEHKDGPFFLAAGFRRPHTPWIAPKKYFDLYPPSLIKFPRERGEPEGDRADIPPAALTRFPDFQKLPDAKKREAIAAYYACVSFVDAQLGVLIDQMDKLKLWDDTLVVFVTDHGYQLGEHGGLARKQTLFQESTRVPLIAVAPGGRAGAVCTRPVEMIDLWRTFADFCGLADLPAGVQGKSFLPLVREPGGPAIREAAYSIMQSTSGVPNKGPGPLLGRSVHTERWRYTEWGDEGVMGVELYDLQTDPREYTNLAQKPEHAKTRAEMKKRLQAARQQALPAKK